MRNQDQLNDQIYITCKAIEDQPKGQSNAKEGEIIAKQCNIDDIDETHIRKIMGKPVNRRKSTKYK